MKKFVAIVLGAIACAVMISAGSGVRAASTQTADGPPPGDRVVCVSKQINEFIYDIGAENHLVAHDLTSVYPPQITKLPSVGYHRALSAEGIISMHPSVFLTDGNVGPQAVLDQLRKVGIPVKVMDPGETMEQSQQLMLRLGRYFDREKAAETIVAKWRRGMAQVKQESRRWAGKPRPRVLMIHFGQIINNYLAVTSGTPAGQIIEWAGGVNAVSAKGGMVRLTPELIAESKPDVIIANNVAFDRFGSAKKFEQLPGVALTPAGKSGRIYMIPEQAIIYFGPRTPATVKELAKMLHP
ncbi:MAG TPA: ABC transporter substrate-binding protein [Gammaproteobacteria bacterium]|nr:ABC transporter substrate-binding protein [Gammaproteobacteria bacterium]